MKMSIELMEYISSAAIERRLQPGDFVRIPVWPSRKDRIPVSVPTSQIPMNKPIKVADVHLTMNADGDLIADIPEGLIQNWL